MTGLLSRREMVVLAGGGLVAGASSANAINAPERVLTAPHRAMGIPSLWGHRATDDAELIPALKGKFRPKFLTIVYINFPSAWNIEINHASWPISGLDHGDRRQKAVNILARRLAGTRFKDMPAPHLPYKRNDNSKKEMESFEKFGFSSQSEIFIFFANPDIGLNLHWPVTFTEFSDTGQPRDTNYSFFNAQVVPQDELNGLAGRMMRLRNYVVDEEYQDLKFGNPDNNISRTYAMNIHFGMPGNESVPMVIDPETGNGTGNEP